MEITFECSKCRQQLLLDEWYLGQAVPCPGCGQSLTKPAIPPVKKSHVRPRRSVRLKAGTFLAVVAVAVVAGFLIQVLRPPDPSYHGKKLSEWLEEDNPQARYGVRDYRGLGNHEEATAEAIQALGEKAIPPLLRMLGAKDSALKTIWVKLLEKQHVARIPYTLAETYQERAVTGFKALGSRAKSALPELSRLFYQTNSTWSAADVLVAIGPESLPVFRAGLTNQKEWVRWASAWGLGNYGSNAIGDVPGLVRCLKDSCPHVRGAAARALERIGQKAHLALPALIESLEDSDRFVRLVALRTIGAFGPQATSAIPAISRLLTNTASGDTNLLKAATNALILIANKGELQAKDQWVQGNLLNAKATMPFSFVYGGQAAEKLLAGWTKKVEHQTLDATRTQHILVWTDPESGLEVRCVALDYADSPAVEWLLYFTNTGQGDSQIIEKIQPLDCLLTGGDKGFVLHRALGDSNSAQSFTPVDEPLAPRGWPGNSPERVFAAKGGRSSDGNMPYFNMDWHQGGMALAIGWSGQWEAGFLPLGDGRLRVRAGQQLTRFKLHAGETVRSPRIVLTFWLGQDPLRGNNLFRQLALKHYLPQKDGQPVFPPICGSVSVTAPDGTYEKPHLDAIAPLKERGFEVFWSDMDPQQWYPGGFPTGTGTWEVDKSKYPNGLKPLGDALRAAGMGYLLWFEPERVHPGTKIDREHPEWVMKAQGEWSQLFRLHDPEARKWLTDCIDAHITTANLTWIRWDFNIEPLGFWRRNDERGRQGITEIRHLEGLYAMWAELQRRHPGLVIDNCSSGGRRLDIEASRYGLPLWHSDLQCEGSHPAADQLQNGALYRWVPLHGCGNFGLEPSYSFRSAMTPGNILCSPCTSPETDAATKKTIAAYKKLRPYMLGDFHPLFPHDASESVWYGYQFNRPEQGDGLIQLFRRAQCEEASRAVRLFGLAPEALYVVTNGDTGNTTTNAGQHLMDRGLAVEIKDKPAAAVILYRKTN
jgi:alpha-galactosidase